MAVSRIKLKDGTVVDVGAKWGNVSGKPDLLKVDGSNGTAAGVSALINKLSTGTATPTDADYYVAQYAGGGTSTTTFHRRPVSALWTYMKSKIADANELGLTKTNYGGTAAKATADSKGVTIDAGSYALKSSIPGATSTSPKMDGTAAVGSETKWAKGDHVHPTDTSRAAATRVKTIEDKIPSEASSTNQLADKKFVTDLVDTLEARYLTADAKGTPFATVAALTASTAKYYEQGTEVTPDINDVAIVTADENHKNDAGQAATSKYQWISSEVGWAFLYVVNNSGLSSTQLSAMNSGITSAKVSTYDGYATTIGNKVDKVSGKGLSTNDFTAAYKTKLDGIASGATKVESSSTNGYIKIGGTDTKVYSHPTGDGNSHIPSGGSSGQFLAWSSSGVAKWVSNPNSDTKNTAGSTNNAAKLFVIGAPSQGANPVTYSQSDVYIDSSAGMHSTTVTIGEHGKMSYNETDGCIDFTFV